MRHHPAPPSGEAADAHAYPATYRLTNVNRWASAVASVGLLAGAAIIAKNARAVQAASRDVAGLVVAALVAGLALWILVRAIRLRLVLWPDRLEHRGAVRVRTIAAADIHGRRKAPGRQRNLVVVPHEGRGRPLEISSDLRRDATSRNWFERLPDLDQAEFEASRERVLNDRELGLDPHEVEARLESARWWSRGLGLIAGVLVLWAKFAPVAVSVNAMLSLALPLLALWACVQWRGLFRLVPDIGTSDIRPTLFPALLLPPMALMLDLPSLASLQSWHAVIVPAIVVGALAAALALALEGRDDPLLRRAAMAGWVLCAAGAYAGAAGLVADIWLDGALAPAVRASVTRLQGRPASAFDRHFASLGPAATPNDWKIVHVPARDFDRLRVGDIACLSEHAGLFGIVWAELHQCADAPDRAPDAAARHWLAHVARPASQRPPLAQRVIDGDWQAVDAELNALQKRYERGEVTQVEVEQAFVPLYDVDPALDTPLAHWVAHAPRSYAAHLAMALHTERQVDRLALAGFDERNSPTLNWRERTAVANDQLAAAHELSTRPVTSLLAEYRFAPNRVRDLKDWVARVVALDPEDVTMRREYLIQHPVCPCRGMVPDDAAMRWLLEAHPSTRVRDALAAYRLFERGVDAGGSPESEALYRQALALTPYPQDAYTSHVNLGTALALGQHVDAAIVEFKAAIATLPGNVHAHESLGWAYELQGRNVQALAEFLVDAERGQHWAQMRVGSFLLQPAPGVKEDRATGARWMRAAANGGEAEARAILRRHVDLMAQYPPTY